MECITTEYLDNILTLACEEGDSTKEVQAKTSQIQHAFMLYLFTYEKKILMNLSDLVNAVLVPDNNVLLIEKGKKKKKTDSAYMEALYAYYDACNMIQVYCVNRAAINMVVKKAHPLSYKIIAILGRADKMTYKEIAEIAGKSMTTIRDEMKVLLNDEITPLVKVVKPGGSGKASAYQLTLSDAGKFFLEKMYQTDAMYHQYADLKEEWKTFHDQMELNQDFLFRTTVPKKVKKTTKTTSKKTKSCDKS